MIRSTTPKILKDIVVFLKENPICISSKIEGEGRGGSLVDEGSIKRKLLNSHFCNHIIPQKPRTFGDIIVIDYDRTTRYVLNIKTSLGGTDNCCSKGGFVYAFTILKQCMN